MIAAQQLTRSFGPHRAVDGFTLTVEPGECVVLLGPNGAGKTTAVRMLAGSLLPDSGTAAIGGACLVGERRRALARLGYLPEGAPLWGEIAGLDLVRLAARARGGGEATVTEVCDRLDLGAIGRRPVERLSKGQRRRVALAMALAGDPPALLLDEPGDGLDPLQQAAMVAVLDRARAGGAALLVTTHDLTLAGRLAGRIAIMAGGRIRAGGTPAELHSRSSTTGPDWLATLFADLCAEPA